MAMLFDENYYDETNVDEKQIAYIEAELDNELDNENGISYDDENEDETKATVMREIGNNNNKLDNRNSNVVSNNSTKSFANNSQTSVNTL